MGIKRTSSAQFEDDILVEDFINGNLRSFETLVLKHQNSVYNIIYRIVGDKEDAHDISQEAFLRAFENIRRYDSKYPFKSWLLRIGINRAIDHLRRKGAYRSKLGPETAYPEEFKSGTRAISATELALLNESQNPEKRALMRDEIETLKKAMAELPANYRAVLALYHIEGMSYREISKILSVSKNTAKTWARRGRKELAKALKGLRNKEDGSLEPNESGEKHGKHKRQSSDRNKEL